MDSLKKVKICAAPIMISADLTRLETSTIKKVVDVGVISVPHTLSQKDRAGESESIFASIIIEPEIQHHVPENFEHMEPKKEDTEMENENHDIDGYDDPLF